MSRSIVVGLLVFGLASCFVVSAFASNAVLGEEYGNGVHAYFAGDFIAAHERLTDVINAGTKDPRALYFRGLVYLKLGRAPEADQDFRRGATLESQDLNRFYNVGKALERVQGHARVRLEKFRLDARMLAMERAERIRKARYEAIRREEERVLREQSLAAPDDLEADGAPSPDAEEENPFAAPSDENPFAAPSEENPFAQPEEEEKEPKAKPEEKEEEKPDAKPDESPEDSPFMQEPGTQPKPKEKPPAEEPDDDGESAPEDPFAEEPDEKKPADKEPSDEKDEQEAAPDDPFAP